ncbi:MAG: NAD(P)H-binding protein [Vicinamibacterales bacterium]
MRIFMTGATGYIGTAVLGALVRAGHAVTVLVRTQDKARELAGPGVTPCLGDLSDPAGYTRLAAGHDAYVLAAFDSSSRRVELDRMAIENLVRVARAELGKQQAAQRALIYTSGVWVLGNTPQPAAEDAATAPVEHVAWRPGHERLVLEACGEGLRTVVVRPGIVYGGTRGIVCDLFRDASNGLIRIFGTGDNHWPLVYDRDLGDLYARLVARGDADGVFHANDEGDERVNDIVAAIRSHFAVDPAVRYVPLVEARAKHGTYAIALALDQVVRSPRARALGWVPSLTSVSGNLTRLLGEWRAGSSTPGLRR